MLGKLWGVYKDFPEELGGRIPMDKKEPFQCQEDMDRMHHQLIEQIARISVDEEEERMKAELELSSEEGAKS